MALPFHFQHLCDNNTMERESTRSRTWHKASALIPCSTRPPGRPNCEELHGRIWNRPGFFPLETRLTRDAIDFHRFPSL